MRVEDWPEFDVK